MATPPTLTLAITGTSPDKTTSAASLQTEVNAALAQTYADFEAGDAAEASARAAAVSAEATARIAGDAAAVQRANHTGTQAISTVSGLQTALDAKAALASPALTGSPTAPTAAPGTDTTQIATTAFANAAVAVETAARVAADALKAPLASPALTGTPTAPTAAPGTNTTQVATTAFTNAAVAVEEAARIAAVSAETTARGALAKGVTVTMAAESATGTLVGADWTVSWAGVSGFVGTINSNVNDATDLVVPSGSAAVIDLAGGSTPYTAMVVSIDNTMKANTLSGAWLPLVSNRQGSLSGYLADQIRASNAAATAGTASSVATTAQGVADTALDVGRGAVDTATDTDTRLLWWSDDQPAEVTLSSDGYVLDVPQLPTGNRYQRVVNLLWWDDAQAAVIEALGDPATGSVGVLRAYDADGAQVWPVDTVDDSLPEYLGYIDGTEIHGVAAADVVMADAAPFTVSAVAPGRGHVKALVSRPALSAVSKVAAVDDLLIPDTDDTIHMVLGLGQSLAVGAQGYPLTTVPVWRDDALIFDTVLGPDVRMGVTTSGAETPPAIDPDDLVGFAPAQAVVSPLDNSYAQTAMEQLATVMASAARQRGLRYIVLAATSGRGGTSYAELKKGGTIPTIYNNLLAGVARAKELAEAMGKRLVVAGAFVKHGEADQSDSAAAYAAKLVEWQADVETDVQAITGQLSGVPFLLAPPSSFFGSGGPSLAMANLHRTDANFSLTGPDYAYHAEYASDLLHMTGPGYFLIGEKAGQAAVGALWSPAGKSSPLIVDNVSRSGAVVTVRVRVPHPPLVIDTALVAAATNYGLAYSVGGVAQTISNVDVTNTASGGGLGTITITLASAPAGTDGRLDVGWPGHSGSRTTGTIPRTNFRDSDPAVSDYDGRRLYSWLTHDQITHA